MKKGSRIEVTPSDFHDDPTEEAERLRAMMAETFRMQERDGSRKSGLLTMAHESLRLALKEELKNNDQ